MGKREYHVSSTQSVVLFHVKPAEKKFSELTESAAMGFFDGVRYVAGCISTAEKEFRTTVFLIFDASC